jgi:hypothetical protein
LEEKKRRRKRNETPRHEGTKGKEEKTRRTFSATDY